MTFTNPEYFYLGIFILMLCALALYSLLQGRKKMSLFGNTDTLKSITLRYSKYLRLTVFSLLLLSLVFLVLTIARPQNGIVETEDTTKGIEAVIMVDVSNSMLATDVAPSRLERAKFLLSNLIDNMSGDRLALGIFAGEAYLQVPITSDRGAVKSILENLSPTMLSSQGTHIAAALEVANRSFTEKTDADKAIILITDGENHEGNVETIAKDIASSGKKLFILGIGTSGGATIPTPNGPLTDEVGNTVVSRLDESLCSEIARLADGEYIHVDNTLSAQAQLLASMQHLKKSSDVTKYTSYDERFQTFGIISLILLTLSLLIPEYIRRRARKKAAKKSVMLLLFMLTAIPPMNAQTASWRALHGANRQFNKGNYAEAQSRYEKIIEKNPTNSRALFNSANAALALGDAEKAVQLYQSAAQLEQEPTIKSRAYHNLGVISQTAALKADEANRQQLLREAIGYYKNALRHNPADDGARYNLELCKRQLKGNKDDKNENQKQQQQQQQNQNQQQKQQQQQPQEQQEQNTTAKQQLLNLTRQAEQKTREKINAARPKRGSKEKNW